MSLGLPLAYEDSPLLSKQTIVEGEVHIWWVDLRISDDKAQSILPFLTAKQKAKYDRLPTEQKKINYLAGRGFLRDLLLAYTGEESIELEYNKFGKPRLVNNSLNISFNYSDTLGRGVYCVSQGCEIGIDLESLDRRGKFDRIIERRFSPLEQEYLAKFSNDTEQIAHQFLRCWTRKEAFGKAIGVGLNYRLREYDFCTKDEQSELLYKAESSSWYFQQFTLKDANEEFLMCLVSKGMSAKKIKARRFVQRASYR